MSIFRDDLAKKFVAELAFAGNGGIRVRVGDIAKRFGLEFKVVEINRMALKITTSGEPSSELNEEKAESLIERLLYIHPEILDRLVSKPSLNTPETSAIATQGATASESPKRNEVSDLKSIIEKFIIIDGSNVLHWMEDNRQADKVNLIPLVIVLTAIRRKGFDFCCYFDASKIFETREKQPEQFKEFEIILKKYPIYFSVAPGGTSADDFIILDAKNSKRKVLSNDRFRDHPIQLPKNQFIKGAVVNCQIAIPMLNIIESLISDFRKAMRDLESELKK